MMRREMVLGAMALVTATTSAAVVGNLRLRRALSATRAQLDEALLQASHDALTGLANRRGIDADLTARMASGDSWVLIVVDLDGFKPVNDTHGHAAGDLVLVETARRLSTVVDPAIDLVGRWGGDEFVILASAPFGAMMLGRDAATVLHEPVTIDGDVRVEVTASVGLVQVFAGDDPRIVKKSADLALQRAKAAGGDTVREYGLTEPKPVIDERPQKRSRDAHPHQVPSELGVVLAR